MTNEEILKLAREAGFPQVIGELEIIDKTILGKFAALVAAAEREECINIMRATDETWRERFGQQCIDLSQFKDDVEKEIRNREAMKS